MFNIEADFAYSGKDALQKIAEKNTNSIDVQPLNIGGVQQLNMQLLERLPS